MRTRLIAGTASAILIVVGVLAGIWMWMKQPSAEPPVAEMIVLESDPSPVYFPRNSPDWKPFEIETVALLHTLEMKEDCLLFSTPATADHPGYLVVWPPDYRLHSGPDGVEVQGDTFIGRPGDRVRVGPSAVNAPDIPFDDRERCVGYELYHIWKATNVTERLRTAPAQPTETPVTMSSDDALTRDAIPYANAFGVSVEEAKRRLLLQGAIGELNGNVSPDYPRSWEWVIW